MMVTDRGGLGEEVSTVDVGHCTLRFLERGSGWRYKTILEKEPETIEWINTFAEDDVLWDVGANVGIYSIYAASRGIRVVCFEPHFRNYYQMCENILLNNYDSLVMPFNTCLGSHFEINHFNMASLDFGSSMSSFGNSLDFRGRDFSPAASLFSLGCRIDDLINVGSIWKPNHLKIDVDGNELPILKSAEAAISGGGVKSVLIELVESDVSQVQAVKEIFDLYSFKLVFSKNNADFVTPDTTDVKNFLFVKA